MARTRFTLETRDGVPVVVHRWEPDSGAVRGVVNVIHGLVEHAGRYDTLAEELNSIGLAVYAEDHRGHGETARSEDELGHFADERGWARVADDLHRVSLRAKDDHPDVPLFLMGQSLGASFTQQLAYTFPDEVDGLVLTAPPPTGLFVLAGEMLGRLERRRLGKHGRSTVTDAYLWGQWNKPFRPVRTTHDFLSRDHASVDRYVGDARCGFTGTTQLGLDVAIGVQAVGRLDWARSGLDKDLPLYILAGSEDPAGGRPGVEELQKVLVSAGFTGVEVHIYEGARHEVLNETNRDEVVADLLAWFEGRLEPAAVEPGQRSS
jgi:alpha-beta hydrolase superfamily lysophospholipase